MTATSLQSLTFNTRPRRLPNAPAGSNDGAGCPYHLPEYGEAGLWKWVQHLGLKRRLTGAICVHHFKCMEILINNEVRSCEAYRLMYGDDCDKPTYAQKMQCIDSSVAGAVKSYIRRRRSAETSTEVFRRFFQYAAGRGESGQRMIYFLLVALVECNGCGADELATCLRLYSTSEGVSAATVERMITQRFLSNHSGNLIHLAAKLGKVDHLRALTDHCGRGPSFSVAVELRDKKGHTPLMSAVCSLAPTALDTVRLLVSMGAQLNALTKDRCNLFQIAASRGCGVNTLRFVAEALHFDSKRDDDRVPPPLHLWVCGRRWLDMGLLRALIDLGCPADVSFRCSAQLAPSGCSTHGDFTCLELLLSRMWRQKRANHIPVLLPASRMLIAAGSFLGEGWLERFSERADWRFWPDHFTIICFSYGGE